MMIIPGYLMYRKLLTIVCVVLVCDHVSSASHSFLYLGQTVTTNNNNNNNHPNTNGLQNNDRPPRNAAVPSVSDKYYLPSVVSELLPSIVSRDPSVITLTSANPCPSGYISDRKGICRQMFQYTVNYGSHSSIPRKPVYYPKLVWPKRGATHRKIPKNIRPAAPSIRDLVRSSSLYRKSSNKNFFTLGTPRISTTVSTTTSTSSSNEVTEAPLTPILFNAPFIDITSLLNANLAVTSSPITTTTDHDD